MTEEEAKTKWCPMVRHVNSQFKPCGNSMPLVTDDRPWPDGYNTCIGSACMMWRWDMVPNPAYRPQSLMDTYPAEPSQIKSTTDGHCGLAP